VVSLSCRLGIARDTKLLIRKKYFITAFYLVTLTLDFGLDHAVPWRCKYGDLTFLVEGVSDETVVYGYGFCATLTST
jgi:hypothetical protein